MKTITIIAALALSGCTAQQMVDASADECIRIGYAAGSAEHIACTERGFRNKDAVQDATVATVATSAAWLIAVDALF